MLSTIDQRLKVLKDVSKYWRTPVFALKSLIDNREFEAIGGGVQLTIAGQNRFEQTWILTDTATQKDSFSFRNLDLLTDIGAKVGNCIVAMNGMTFDD